MESGNGGPGGAGTSVAGSVGLTNSDSGGGGASVGRVRINSSAPAALLGEVSPPESSGGLTLGAILLAGH